MTFFDDAAEPREAPVGVEQRRVARNLDPFGAGIGERRAADLVLEHGRAGDRDLPQQGLDLLGEPRHDLANGLAEVRLGPEAIERRHLLVDAQAAEIGIEHPKADGGRAVQGGDLVVAAAQLGLALGQRPLRALAPNRLREYVRYGVDEVNVVLGEGHFPPGMDAQDAIGIRRPADDRADAAHDTVLRQQHGPAEAPVRREIAHDDGLVLPQGKACLRARAVLDDELADDTLPPAVTGAHEQ